MKIKLPNDFGNIEHDSSSFCRIESPFELNAEDFLKFAEVDIEGIKKRGNGCPQLYSANT